MDPSTALAAVKLAHTVVWALLVLCIVAIPVAALRGRFALAGVLSLVLLAEAAVLAANSMRCPLTDVAARYTSARNDAFDIYLPEWLARNNKRIFGPIWIAGELVFAAAYLRRRRV